jgi:hypothetical protein
VLAKRAPAMRGVTSRREAIIISLCVGGRGGVYVYKPLLICPSIKYTQSISLIRTVGGGGACDNSPRARASDDDRLDILPLRLDASSPYCVFSRSIILACGALRHTFFGLFPSELPSIDVVFCLSV